MLVRKSLQHSEEAFVLCIVCLGEVMEVMTRLRSAVGTVLVEDSVRFLGIEGLVINRRIFLRLDRQVDFDSELLRILCNVVRLLATEINTYL